ncbi:helix-turn-helix transcriptional regulator (plasmid) [Roseomonas mucosa]|uniref:helix-turn-helix transcriptional regulator n=1 Tax=Roseomonas mucosa TaxID=207340 RepID=UPI0030CD4735
MADALTHSLLDAAEAVPCVQNEHTPGNPPPPVTGRRLLSWLATIGWTERELARRTGRHQTAVRRWIDGRSPVDPDVAAWLGTLAAFVAAHPGPRSLTCRRDATRC